MSRKELYRDKPTHVRHFSESGNKRGVEERKVKPILNQHYMNDDEYENGEFLSLELKRKSKLVQSLYVSKNGNVEKSKNFGENFYRIFRDIFQLKSQHKKLKQEFVSEIRETKLYYELILEQITQKLEQYFLNIIRNKDQAIWCLQQKIMSLQENGKRKQIPEVMKNYSQTSRTKNFEKDNCNIEYHHSGSRIQQRKDNDFQFSRRKTEQLIQKTKAYELKALKIAPPADPYHIWAPRHELQANVEHGLNGCDRESNCSKTILKQRSLPKEQMERRFRENKKQIDYKRKRQDLDNFRQRICTLKDEIKKSTKKNKDV